MDGVEDQGGVEVAPGIAKAIALGAAAGHCRVWARTDPRVTSGMTKAADGYSAQAAKLLSGSDE